jgi:hypothetical protein
MQSTITITTRRARQRFVCSVTVASDREDGQRDCESHANHRNSYSELDSIGLTSGVLTLCLKTYATT